MCLSKEEIYNVHLYIIYQRDRDTLVLTHKGLKEMRSNKLTLLKHQYEMFSIEENETIQSTIIDYKLFLIVYSIKYDQ